MSLLPVRVLRLVLPYPPGVNEYWRTFTPKKGPARPIVSAIGRAYKAAVRKMLREGLTSLLEGPIRLDIDAFRPRRAGDVDRHLKVLFDVLQRDEEEDWPGVYANDSQAFRVKIEHWDTEPSNPRLQVTITEDQNPRQHPVSWSLQPAQQESFTRAREQLADTRTKERERVKRKTGKVDFNEAVDQARKSKAEIAKLARPASYPARGRGERR